MFAQTLAIPSPLRPFIILSRVESTNNYAMAKLHEGMLLHGTSLMALEQTAGKGQRGKKWISQAGENITMSTVLSPAHSLLASASAEISRSPFILSAAAALACYDFIKQLNVTQLFIKWPNDLYINDRKAGGILIENVYKGTSMEWSIIGTGINLNQTGFGDLQKTATSIRVATGEQHDLIKAGRLLQQKLARRFSMLQSTPSDQIMEEYNSVLYKRNEEVRLKKQNISFATVIKRVTVDGELVTTDSMERNFRVGEVEFVNA